jgi:hypothetical protein
MAEAAYSLRQLHAKRHIRHLAHGETSNPRPEYSVSTPALLRLERRQATNAKSTIDETLRNYSKIALKTAKPKAVQWIV